MKIMSKRFSLKMSAVGCLLIGMFLLGGCADKDKTASITEANSSVINTENYTLSIYDRFNLQENESSEDVKYYEALNPISVLQVYDTTAGNADIEANASFYKSLMAEAYGISESQIDAGACSIENHDTCYYLAYNYTQDGHDYIASVYIIYEEGTILILTEASYDSDEEAQREELLEMAQTVKYTGAYHLPEQNEYPFSIENKYVRVTVSEGFDSLQAPAVKEETAESYKTDSKKIVIRYTAADDYDKGMISAFSIEETDDQDTSAQKQAEKTYERYQDGTTFEASAFDEIRMGDVFPLDSELSKETESDIADVTAYRVCAYSRETNYSIERYYFQIGDQKICINISYPFEDFATRDELYRLLCDVDFLSEVDD